MSSSVCPRRAFPAYSNKHSSLLRKFINYGQKSFITLGSSLILIGKAESTRVEPLAWLHYECLLLTLPKNVRLAWKWLTVSNIPSYFSTKLIKAVKNLMVETHGQIYKKFTHVTYNCCKICWLVVSKASMLSTIQHFYVCNLRVWIVYETNQWFLCFKSFHSSILRFVSTLMLPA